MNSEFKETRATISAILKDYLAENAEIEISAALDQLEENLEAILLQKQSVEHAVSTLEDCGGFHPSLIELLKTELKNKGISAEQAASLVSDEDMAAYLASKNYYCVRVDGLTQRSMLEDFVSENIHTDYNSQVVSTF